MNKYQEALNILKYSNHDDLAKVKAIEILQELVDKTIPKKGIEKEIPPCVLTAKYCPSCGKRLINFSYHIPYCEHCGQKLDWSED